MDKNTIPIINDALCLKNTTKAHFSQLKSWFSGKEQVLSWAGSSFGFPNTDLDFESQLNKANFISYSLVYNDDLVGFGQYQLHSSHLHLGRLAIKPCHRGKGLASTLLSLLIEKGEGQAEIKTVSLFVYVNNLVAYKTYISEGFTKFNFPHNKSSIEGCDYLTLTRK